VSDGACGEDDAEGKKTEDGGFGQRKRKDVFANWSMRHLKRVGGSIHNERGCWLSGSGRFAVPPVSMVSSLWIGKSLF
jgi:hypothetical protein